MMFDSAAYFVAKHYGMSLTDVWKMNISAFEKAFTWAAASERVRAEEMDKMSAESNNKSRIASTHGAMPFSN